MYTKINSSPDLTQDTIYHDVIISVGQIHDKLCKCKETIEYIKHINNVIVTKP